MHLKEQKGTPGHARALVIKESTTSGTKKTHESESDSDRERSPMEKMQEPIVELILTEPKLGISCSTWTDKCSCPLWEATTTGHLKKDRTERRC